MNTPLPNWLVQRAQLSPKQTALSVGPEQWTWAEVAQQVDATARRLCGFRVQPGQRVALLMQNSAACVMLIHAITRLGAVLVPLNTRLTPSEILWQVQDSGASHLIADAANADTAQAAGRELPSLRLAFIAGGTPLLSDLPEAEATLQDAITLDALHSILYTSGTTGKPKGAMLTYGNHFWSAMASALNLGVRADDVWLACLPLFHVGGLAILLRGTIYGYPTVVQAGFDAAAVNQAIDRQAVTHISVVSAMLQRMIAQRGDHAYPSTLRCVLLGGGPAPLPLLEQCAARGIPVVQTYGMTETASQFATLAPDDALRKLGSAGKPLFGNMLRIERDGQACKSSDVGEIVVRGPTVTPGYINRPDATAQALRDGWLHIGDLGYVDGEGYLYVVSRRDDLIISGGENVYPAEVESVLLSHPALEEAAVVGIPDPHWGQVPLAAIKLQAGQTITETDLRDYCVTRLAKYKVPAHFRFVEALPRNAAGKVLRRTLVEQFTT